MENHSNSVEAFMKRVHLPMNNHTNHHHYHHHIQSSFKTFYSNHFASSVGSNGMASSTNNYHQHPLQHQYSHHHYLGNNYDATTLTHNSSYCQPQFHPHMYQPLTPPPHQNDYNLNNMLPSYSNARNLDISIIKSEQRQQCSLGMYWNFNDFCAITQKLKLNLINFVIQRYFRTENNNSLSG